MISSAVVSRRAVLSAGAAVSAGSVLAGLAGCTGDGGASAGGDSVGAPFEATVLTGFEIQPWDAYLYIARDRGYFAEENLTITIEGGLGTGRNMVQLEGGRAHFATLDVMTAITEYSKAVGLDYQPRDENDNGHTSFRLVSLLHHDLMAGIVSLERSNIVRPRDLAGKIVAIIPGGAPAALFPALGGTSNLDVSRVELVPSNPGLFNSQLRSGQVDATVTFVPERGAVARAVEQPVTVIKYSDWISDSLGSAIGVTADFAASNADVVRRFNRAAMRGLQDLRDDPDEAGRVFWAANNTLENWDEELSVLACQETAGYIQPEPDQPLGYLDEERVMLAIALLQAFGQATAAITPGDFVANDLLGV